MIEDFFEKLKESLEEHSKELKRGKAFQPLFLKKSTLTKDIFPKIADSLANKLDLQLKKEWHNPMPKKYEWCGKRQRADYVFFKNTTPRFLFEIESLDRSQLYVFHDWKEGESKLRYYNGTIRKYFEDGEIIPQYFIWLLLLPDMDVSHYQLWDVNQLWGVSGKQYRLIHPSLRKLIQHNPYRFYDHLIKTCARLYLKEKVSFKNSKGKEVNKNLMNFQKDCELVFITCTIKELILSRGKDGFDPEKEIRVILYW